MNLIFSFQLFCTRIKLLPSYIHLLPFNERCGEGTGEVWKLPSKPSLHPRPATLPPLPPLLLI